MILAADIGGTNTVLAVAASGDNGIELSSIRRYDSRQFSSFELVFEKFLSENPEVSVSSLCLAVAGPVFDNRCQLTNLSMGVDAEPLSRRAGIKRVLMLNDLAASGYGLEVIPAAAVSSIHNGQGIDRGNRILISPGTGLGEVIVHDVDGKYVPLASEGGHVDFAPFDGITERLWSFMKRSSDRVSVEDVLSGPGIFNIFKFLISENGVELDAQRRQGLTSEPGLKITNWAVEQQDPLSLQTIMLFLDILAAEAGNMALKALPTGGVYLGGGILPRLIPLFDKPRFVSVFSSKGIHQSLLKQFSISIITDVKLPLYGAVHHLISSGEA